MVIQNTPKELGYHQEYKMMGITLSYRVNPVRFDMYCSFPGRYTNKYFAFKINPGVSALKFIYNQIRKFSLVGNQIKAMYTVFEDGKSYRITGKVYNELEKVYFKYDEFNPAIYSDVETLQMVNSGLQSGHIKLIP